MTGIDFFTGSKPWGKRAPSFSPSPARRERGKGVREAPTNPRLTPWATRLGPSADGLTYLTNLGYTKLALGV
ncbi:hypothetical protein SBA2_150026 [Acidobacteriia bacterium SbA2]|nr:hypothetical protein SBA2_150026 [Acidobacteriia bacterium SbA2]